MRYLPFLLLIFFSCKTPCDDPQIFDRWEHTGSDEYMVWSFMNFEWVLPTGHEYWAYGFTDDCTIVATRDSTVVPGVPTQIDQFPVKVIIEFEFLLNGDVILDFTGDREIPDYVIRQP